MRELNPYRSMDLPELPQPGRWLRLLAALTPERLGARWSWYRWTVGGRWSRVVDVRADGRYAFRWRRAQRCPGRLHADVFGGDPVPHGVCVDYSEALLMVDEECGLPEAPLEGVCHCEVHRG